MFHFENVNPKIPTMSISEQLVKEKGIFILIFFLGRERGGGVIIFKHDDLSKRSYSCSSEVSLEFVSLRSIVTIIICIKELNRRHRITP